MSDDLTASEKAVAQAMYDIKPNMIGAMKLAKAISAMMRAEIEAAKPPLGMYESAALMASHDQSPKRDQSLCYQQANVSLPDYYQGQYSPTAVNEEIRKNMESRAKPKRRPGRPRKAAA